MDPKGSVNLNPELQIDPLLPPQMAAKAEQIGVAKAGAPFLRTFSLAVLAGAFIALGGVFSTTVTAGMTGVPYGFVKFTSGLAFTLGLILVVIGGAELFTGNNLIMIAFCSRKVSLKAMLINWGIVYLGNFVGSILTAGLMFFTRQYAAASGAVGLNALTIGNTKTGLDFIQAVALGIMCNALVCLAVWLTYSARSTTDKILAIIPPITAFVAAGFEHSVANMYFIPLALFIKTWGRPDFYTAIQKTALDFPNLTWANFLFKNLIPVTLGNIIGGAVMVGLVYWFIYLRCDRARPLLLK
jgi:formate transporter FocA